MTIHEIRENVLKMLADVYKQAEEAKTSSPEELERFGFMRKQDADAIRKVCAGKGMYVSFRAAGPDTLTRIGAGNPCKGHEIMDKSIKRNGDNWTYLAPENEQLGRDGESVLDALKGYVGCPYIPRRADGSIDYEAEDRAPRVIGANEDGTRKAIFYLDDVYVLPEGFKAGSKCTYSKLPASGVTTEDLKRAYTGDYDLHDLIMVREGRPLATTPLEMDALDWLNGAMLGADTGRKGNVAKTTTKRFHESPYALIRHGAQTSFLSFLISAQGEPDLKGELEKIRDNMRAANYVSRLPFGSSVVKIDNNIAMFDNKNNVYILKGVAQIYKFYMQKDLINHIPFYNFFDALYQQGKYRAEVVSYASYINEILMVNLGLIRHKSIR